MSDLHEKFNWGQVVKDHVIGPYTIREYHPRKRQGKNVLPEIDGTAVEFHGYIDGQDTHESWASLEDAVVGMIVRRMVGLNRSAIAVHFMAGLRGMSE